MLYTLRVHPESRSSAVENVAAHVARQERGGVVMRYIVTGRISELRLPRLAAPARADQLWRHTCFEAFVRARAAPDYYELNFSPSSQWAAYRFSSYRNGMTASELSAPRIEVQSSDDRYQLQAAVELRGLESLPGDSVWRVGLSAVIEEMNGRISYWALAHPPGRADFHHPDCFALELDAPSRA